MYDLRRITGRKDLLTLAKDARVIMMSDDVMFVLVNIKGPRGVDKNKGFGNRFVDIDSDGVLMEDRDFDLKQFVFENDKAVIPYTLNRKASMKSFEVYEIVQGIDS
jgi:hypothetical protein